MRGCLACLRGLVTKADIKQQPIIGTRIYFWIIKGARGIRITLGACGMKITLSGIDFQMRNVGCKCHAACVAQSVLGVDRSVSGLPANADRTAGFGSK